MHTYVRTYAYVHSMCTVNIDLHLYVYIYIYATSQVLGPPGSPILELFAASALGRQSRRASWAEAVSGHGPGDVLQSCALGSFKAL